MKFSDNLRQLIMLMLIVVTVIAGLLHVAPAKPYIARNVVAYEKVWHADGSLMLNLSKNGHDFAYHTNPETHRHPPPIYQITLKNVLCQDANCLTCNPTKQEGSTP